MRRRVPKKRAKLPRYKTVRKITVRGQPAVLTYSAETKLYWVFLGNIRTGTPLGYGPTEEQATARSVCMIPVNRPHKELSIGAVRTDADIPRIMSKVNSEPLPEAKSEFGFVNQELLR